MKRLKQTKNLLKTGRDASLNFVILIDIDCMVLNGVFNSIFNNITAASVLIHAFLDFFQPVICTKLFPSHWLLSHITIVETTNGGERGINPVAMTTINPCKEYCPSQGSSDPLFSSSQRY